MGRGLVAKCWGSFAIAIFVTVLGEAALGVLVRYAPAWPVAGFEWYTSFLAAAALALAPAYQVAAQRRATQRGTGKAAGSSAEQALLPAPSLSGS
jgi:membrane protein implicated in regulation of membrane protease activity